MTGIRLEKLSFANVGYYFFFPVNNIGNMFLILLFVLVLLTVFIAYGVYMLVLYICSGTRPIPSNNCARVVCNIFDSMRSLFSTNQIVLVVCVMLYFKHETTYYSKNIVSGTQPIKFDFFISLVLMVGLLIQFGQVLVMTWTQKWFGVLNKVI